MKDFFKTVSDSIEPEILRGIAIALCIVMLFAGGFTVGNLSAFEVPVESVPVNNTVADSTVPSTEATTVPTTAPQEESTSASEASEAPSEPSAPSEESAEGMSTAEIVKLYNDSANKVKTNATKVVKNYEDREFNKETLVVPGVLKSLVNTVVPKFMGDDTEPVEYVGTEEIKANFIVPEQDYVSVLTEADVVEATCTDNGTEYEITIKVKDETNPAPGKGVGAAFDVIETSDITDNEYASMLEKFDTSYFNCVLRCKIDKATGNMTWANYMTPLRMDIVANMMGTHNVSAEISFEKDYNIFY